MYQFNQPLVSSDMIIRQNQTIPSAWCGADDTPSGPSWTTSTLPTPALANKGLSLIVLNDIITTINRNATRDYHSKYNPNSSYLACLPCIGITIGIIICLTSMRGFGGIFFIIGMIIFCISGFCAVIMLSAIGRKNANAVEFAMNNARRYVEITLNEKWQSSRGIRWNIVEEKTMYSSGTSDNKRVGTHTWYNIGVASLQDDNPVVVVPAYVSHVPQPPPPYATEGQVLIPRQGEQAQYTNVYY